jgi:hypothetical protein
MTTEPDSAEKTNSQTTQQAGGAADLQDAGAKAKEVMRRLGPVGVLAMIAAALPAIGGFTLLGFLPRVSEWLQGQDGWGITIYIGGFTLLAGLALLPTYAQAVLAGYTFGLVRGTSAALTGILGASLVGYLIARRASLDFSKSSNLWFFIGGIIVTIIVAGIIGLWANRVLAKVTNQEATAAADGDDAA